MQWKVFAVISGVAVAGAALAGCGSADGPPARPSSLSVTSPVSVSSVMGSQQETAQTVVPSTDDDAVTQAPPVAVTPTQVASVVPSAAAPSAQLSLFYVAEGDDGTAGPAIGCGDSLVMVTVPPPTSSSGDQLSDSFAVLLSNHERDYGESGLYNALWRSSLQLDGWSQDGDVVTVRLSGTLLSGGVCDDPRIINQLKHTAEVAVGAGQAEVLVNDTPLGTLLSGR